MGDLSAQNAGIEAMLKQVLDRVSSLDIKVDGLQDQLASNVKRADLLEERLEHVASPLQAPGKAPASRETDPHRSMAPNSDPDHLLRQQLPPNREAASTHPSAPGSGFGSDDHRDAHLRRGDARGLLGNPLHAPGAGNSHVHRSMNNITDDTGDPYDRHDNCHRYHATPKMDFPKFDGENPKLWQQECETYFELYQVLPSLRTRYASLNFRSTAALWLRNVESKGKVEEWEELCRLVHDKFGKNKYVYYRRQLRQLKQVGSVSEYIQQFEKLRNQLLLYNSALDENFFIDEFIEGLKSEYRAAIRLHLPADMDTACLLAMLQEEELEATAKSPIKDNYKSSHRFDRTHKDVKSAVRTDETKKHDSGKWEEKLDALKAYRRAKNLCFVCGEKYSRTHKCPDQVPLHIIEELMDILPGNSSFGQESSDGESDPDDLMMIASVAAPEVATEKGGKSRCTIRLPGVIGKHQIQILIDSGSASSFISTRLAETLQCASQPIPPVQFTVANGSPMHCNACVPDFEWSVQGHTFHHTVNILSLGCYDMIWPPCHLAWCVFSS
ncbi:hypothetical protein QYE76_003131 [Lolium multiflorum]|uniref:Retrotransposon gag domain-containing protein n=1 Tax=Lolium multiflorum TaxID=4521 RepID=A0AAD8VER6_LOLMU|nr:hypothetical protein QYE76_018606 [Lolium multiflorum]KAK1628816.1 hypothetical protein QYE76_003131 [Lolium multiflorum]